jgi:hypothetical protein
MAEEFSGNGAWLLYCCSFHGYETDACLPFLTMNNGPSLHFRIVPINPEKKIHTSQSRGTTSPTSTELTLTISSGSLS